MKYLLIVMYSIVLDLLEIVLITRKISAVSLNSGLYESHNLKELKNM